MFSQATLFPQATIVSHLNPPCNVDQFSGGSREGARGGGRSPHLIFFPKRGRKGRKNLFWRPAPPPPLSQGLDDHPPRI